MEIVTAVFATVVAASCFAAILLKDLREGRSNAEDTASD
jgi:hypothetical protein